MGHVKTACLQGDMGESERQFLGDPPPDARRLLGLSRDDLLKLAGSVCGICIAPKLGLQKSPRTCRSLGGEQHPLDQT
eukprot:9688847-Lingulodinium_polyedra.AAC.1